MKAQLGHIVQNLFHAGSLEAVPVSRLQEVADKHPYFGTAHLLLSQKLRHGQSPEFDKQVQRTALYFHDPLWLHWQLNEPETAAPPAAAAELATLPLPAEETSHTFHEPEVEQPSYDRGDAREEPVEGTGTIDEPDSIEPLTQPNPEADPAPPAPWLPEPVEEPTTPPPANLPGPETQEPQPVTEPPVTQSAEAPLVFEAYHTIDYFASQGIKVPAEPLPNDRLGKQLKSFTEWLKTMKRLPQTAADEKAEEPGDQVIRRIAAGSLEQKEVVTETMAEVLVKQDKRDEAIAIYKKLSLLDPSKSAYFAAKIDQLKEN